LPREGWTGLEIKVMAIAAGLVAVGFLVFDRGDRTGRAAPPPAVLRVDPNTAPPGVLLAIPALGPTILPRMLEAREKAPFKSLADIDRRVKGVGPRTIETWAPLMRIEPEKSEPAAAQAPLAGT
jgi:competence protein ComEA